MRRVYLAAWRNKRFRSFYSVPSKRQRYRRIVRCLSLSPGNSRCVASQPTIASKASRRYRPITLATHQRSSRRVRKWEVEGAMPVVSPAFQPPVHSPLERFSKKLRRGLNAGTEFRHCAARMRSHSPRLKAAPNTSARIPGHRRSGSGSIIGYIR